MTILDEHWHLTCDLKIQSCKFDEIPEELNTMFTIPTYTLSHGRTDGRKTTKIMPPSSMVDGGIKRKKQLHTLGWYNNCACIWYLICVIIYDSFLVKLVTSLSCCCFFFISYSSFVALLRYIDANNDYVKTEAYTKSCYNGAEVYYVATTMPR